MYRALAQNASQAQHRRRGFGRLFAGAPSNRTAAAAVFPEQLGYGSLDFVPPIGLDSNTNAELSPAFVGPTTHSGPRFADPMEQQDEAMQEIVGQDPLYQQAYTLTPCITWPNYNIRVLQDIPNNSSHMAGYQLLQPMDQSSMHHVHPATQSLVPLCAEPSLKRPMSAGALEEDECRPSKSARLQTNVPLFRDGAERDESAMSGELHEDIGRDKSDKFRCRCGKKYTAYHNLQKHIESQHGVRHECSECGALLARKHAARKHAATNHCKERKAARQLCGTLVQEDNAQAPFDHCAQAEASSCQEQASEFWTSAVSSSHDNGSDVEKPTRNLLDTARLVQPTAHLPPPSLTGYRDVVGRFREPCLLCKEFLGSTYDELEAHAKRHLEEYSLKKLRCHVCQISFAQKQDLDWHFAAAAKGHCGLEFDHRRFYRPDEPGLPAGRYCSGHHPPFDSKTSLPTNHEQTQLRLHEWEYCQLRAYCVVVNRAYSSLAHTVQDDQAVAGLRSPSRISHASLESFRSAPPHVRYMDSANVDCLIPGLEQLAMTNAQPSVSAPETSSQTYQLGLDPTALTGGQFDSYSFAGRDLTEPVIPILSTHADEVRSLRRPSDMVMRQRPRAVSRSPIQLGSPARVPKTAYVRFAT